MFQGFYDLTSGMLTQNRNLNVISNNISNLSTPGYKSDTMVSTTFQQELFYRNGNVDKTQNQVGNINMIRVPSETITNYEKGNLVTTGNSLDFAITGQGFFHIATAGGDAYTRNGSFYIDNEGYLALKGAGRVQGTGGDIYLDNDNIRFDGAGGIYDSEGEILDNLEIVDFDNYTDLVKQENGLFTTNAQSTEVETPQLLNKALELSNASPVQQMQDMIASQRSLQSASQILKIYDQVMAKATTEIARF